MCVVLCVCVSVFFVWYYAYIEFGSYTAGWLLFLGSGSLGLGGLGVTGLALGPVGLLLLGAK